MSLPNLGEITKITLPDSKFKDIPGLVGGIFEWIFGFAAALAIIAVVYSGIMYITAGGDAAKAEKAKNNLFWAIIGVIIAILAMVIIQWVSNILNKGTT